MGEAPVIYAPSLTLYSQQNIEQALYSNGHLHGRCDTIIVNKRHKCSVIYQLTPGPQYYLHQYHQTFDNDSIRLAYEADATKSLLRVGGHLNLNKLSDERSRIVTALHNRGYYYINKDFISFDIDTLRGSTAAIVTMRLQLPIGADSLRAYRVQHYRNINITIANPDNQTDSVYKRTHYHGLNITYQSKPRLSRRLLPPTLVYVPTPPIASHKYKTPMPTSTLYPLQALRLYTYRLPLGRLTLSIATSNFIPTSLILSDLI